jgi:hypothetical protein
MAVDINLSDIGSGFNRSIINDNFQAISAAFENSLGRQGTTPNSMNADIDMDSNDLLNVGDIQTNRLYVDGVEFVPSDVSSVGDRGWSPAFAIVSDSDRRVLQLTGYIGGEGTAPTENVGKYVGATQMETLIANGVDIRGPQGASGAGTGDMLAAQNLNDVASKPTAFSNIKQAATTTATGVVELATTTEAAAGVDTSRAVTPAGLTAFAAANPSGSEVLLDEGTISGVNNLDISLTSYTNYKHIRVVISGIRPVTNNAELRMRTSSNGGSSFDTGGFDYVYSNNIIYSNNASTYGTVVTSYWRVEGGISNTSPNSMDIDITFYDWQQSTVMKYAGSFVKATASSFAISTGHIGGYRVAAQVNNALRFYLSSGNFSTARYTVYGIK